MFSIGMRVMGQWHNGGWYPGRIGQQGNAHGQPQWFVEFDDGDSAWLTAERIQSSEAQGYGAKQASGGGYNYPPPGNALVPGVPVMADWTEDSWYPGYVAEASPDASMYFVQFDDGDSKWLQPYKIRPRYDAPLVGPGAAAGFPAGARVSGLWHNGAWYDGVVAKASPNQTMCFVQFDDGDSKWLPPHQLRNNGPVPTMGPPQNPWSQPQGGYPGYGQAPQGPYSSPSNPNPYPAPPAQAQAPVAPVPDRVVEKVIERQVLVVRCSYCRGLTPADMANCKECGAKMS